MCEFSILSLRVALTVTWICTVLILVFCFNFVPLIGGVQSMFSHRILLASISLPPSYPQISLWTNPTFLPTTQLPSFSGATASSDTIPALSSFLRCQNLVSALQFSLSFQNYNHFHGYLTKSEVTDSTEIDLHSILMFTMFNALYNVLTDIFQSVANYVTVLFLT